MATKKVLIAAAIGAAVGAGVVLAAPVATSVMGVSASAITTASLAAAAKHIEKVLCANVCEEQDAGSDSKGSQPLQEGAKKMPEAGERGLFAPRNSRRRGGNSQTPGAFSTKISAKCKAGAGSQSHECTLRGAGNHRDTSPVGRKEVGVNPSWADEKLLKEAKMAPKLAWTTQRVA